MKQIVEIKRIKIKNCRECPYLTGGWYGHGDAGGISYYCKKSYRRKLSDFKYYSREKHTEAEMLTIKALKKIPFWCFLDNYKPGKLIATYLSPKSR